jgi:hypothetical protein
MTLRSPSTKDRDTRSSTPQPAENSGENAPLEAADQNTLSAIKGPPVVTLQPASTPKAPLKDVTAMDTDGDTTLHSSLGGVIYDPNSTAIQGPQGWVEQMDEKKRQEMDSAVIGEDALDFMPNPNFVYTSHVATKLEDTRTDGNVIKVLHEALIKHDKEMKVIKLTMINNGRKSQAALDLAAHNKIELREVKALAVDSARQYSQQVLEISGNGLPDRDRTAEQNPKDHICWIFHKYFELKVTPDHLACAHFKGSTNHLYVMFLEFGPESAHDMVLKRSMNPKHRSCKIYARVCKCKADARISFLLCCCQRNNIVSGIHIFRSGRVMAKINVGLNEAKETLWKRQILDAEEDVRAIMSPKCREEEEKRNTEKGKIGAKFGAEKVKAIADTKAIYMENNENNRNLQKSLLIEKGYHILSNTQKVSQELRLTKKLREIRLTRPRTPVMKVNSHPKANLKKRQRQGKIRPNHKDAKKAKRSDMKKAEEKTRKEGKEKVKKKIKKTGKPFMTGGNSEPTTKAIDLKDLYSSLPEEKRIEFINTYVKPTPDQQKQKKIPETITLLPKTIDLNDLCKNMSPAQDLCHGIAK